MRSGRFTRATCVLLLHAFTLAGTACRNESRAPELRLHEAYAATARPVALRLHGFAYTPPRRVTRGGDELEPSALRLQNIALATAARGSAPNVTGVAQLLGGQTARALRSLQQAAKDSNDAPAWNDLAVALFDHASRTDDPREFALALSATDESLMRGETAEALFNRAAVLEALGLSDAAAKAWSDRTRLRRKRD